MEERIIFAVSSKPCLFDTTADSYRDINTKNAAWRQVSTIVGLPEEDYRRKWRGLRDRYQRERRAEKEKKRSGSAASGQQPWRFCHILSFLDPFIVPRATSGNFKARPLTSSTSVVATGASRPSTSPTSATITSTGVVRPSTTSSTSMTSTGAAMEDDEMEEAPLDLGPPEIIMNLTEVTTEDLVEQDVAVERNEEEQRHTRRHRRYQPPDPLNSFQQRLLQAVERDAAQPDAHRKEDEETLFAMSLVPTLKRLPQQRKAAVKVQMYQLLFQAEFNEMESI
ncbi:transcription factor Adf-1-like [Salvelinus fontinalis]|uniref:transcription factor Adf-1-like n=2 Tax=Salvelinus fontinalis TaxID=8038 RepID=UPI0024860EC3|nr:transcription factor Adf-1-like [Salvelinus fontinalis]